jgi:hypothetical protein
MVRTWKSLAWAATCTAAGFAGPSPGWANESPSSIVADVPAANAADSLAEAPGELALTSFFDSCDSCGESVCGDAVRGAACGTGVVGGLDPWNFNFSQTVDYGTNLALPISLTPLNTPVGPLSDPSISGIVDSIGLLNPLDPLVARFRDDWQFQTNAGAVRNWNLSDDSSFSAGYDFYQSLHPRVEELDLMSHSALANYSRRVSDDTIVGVDYQYVYYFLDGSSFVSQNTVTPTLQTRWNDRVDLKGTVSYGNANFRQTDFLNSDNYAATAEMYYYTDAARSNYLTMGGGYGYSNAFDDSFSYHVPNVFVGAAWWFGDSRRNQFEIIASYYDYDFQGVDPVEEIPREDNIYSLTPIVTRTINDTLRLFASYTYYSSDSTIARQDYDSSLVSFGALMNW